MLQTDCHCPDRPHSSNRWFAYDASSGSTLFLVDGATEAFPSANAETSGKTFILQINLTDYDAGYLSVVLPEDAARGNSGANSKLTQRDEFTTDTLPKANDWTITAALDTTNEPMITSGKIDANDEFGVEFTFSGGTGEIPTLLDAQIQVKDADGMDVTDNDIH